MRAVTDRSLSFSIRCYRGLLRAYPQSFLMEFEDLLCQAFGDLAHRAVRTKGIWGLFVLWMRTVPDLISSALSQRFQSKADWRFRLRWIAACAAGAAIGAILMVVVGGWADRIQIARGMSIFPRSEQAFRMLVLQFAATFGFVPGYFQSLAFGWKGSRRFAWILATTLGMISAVGSTLAIPLVATYLNVTIHPWRLFVDNHPTLYYGGGAMFCVSVLGILQSLVLAGRNPRTAAWIPASAIGVLADGSIMFIRVDRIFGNRHSSLVLFAVLGLIVGTVYGLLTVLPLEWILQPRESQEVSGKSLS
jgi:hypothetical protein